MNLDIQNGLIFHVNEINIHTNILIENFFYCKNNIDFLIYYNGILILKKLLININYLVKSILNILKMIIYY